MKLKQSFFNNKSTLQVAEDLLGKVLVYQTEQGVLKGLINMHKLLKTITLLALV